MADRDDRTMQDRDDDEEIGIDLGVWIRFLWDKRAFIVAVTSVFAIAGVILAFLIPAQYTATATLLPPQVADSKLSSVLSNLGGLATDIASPGTNMSQLYPDIIKSSTIISGLLAADYEGKTFKDILQKSYGFKDDSEENLMIVLKENVIQASNAMRTNIVSVSVTYTDPDIAAAMANEILNQMEMYFKTKYKSVATSQRLMIETRLSEIADSLRIAENNLMMFQETNRSTSLSPKLQVSEARFLREVEIHNTVYLELNRQRELAKISELQLKPILNVLDNATPPLFKSKPSRKKIIALFMIIGFISAVGYLNAPALMHVGARVVQNG